MNSDNRVPAQTLLWMFFIRFFVWTVPVGRVMHVVTESRAQSELTFYLPRLAKLVVDVMDAGWRLTKWGVFNPQITVVRDPDFCASNRSRLPLSFKLFGEEGREYMESFLPEEDEEEDTEESEEQAFPQACPPPPTPQNPWWLKVVVDNGPVPHRQPQEVDEVPVWLRGVSDTKTLYDDEDETDPGEHVLDRSPFHRRPRPIHGS